MSEAAVLNNQWRAFLDAFMTNRRIHWVNHPVRNSIAESKLYQLTKAKQSGFVVPRTIVTNSKSEAAQFVRQVNNKAIIKALDAPVLNLGGEEAFVFTSLFRDEYLTDDNGIRAAPVIIQEHIEPKRDIRVTVVGERIFAAATVTTSVLDWRAERDPVLFEPYELPVAVTNQCIELVASFGLRFGAIDLLEHSDGWLFLELNPNGEWGWLQSTGFDIAGALADELALA